MHWLINEEVPTVGAVGVMIEEFTNKLLPMVIEANKAIMEIYNSNYGPSIEYKDDNSPVTSADLIAHTIINNHLTKLYPEIPIVSEEASEEQNRHNVKSSYYWLVDPLDGTKEFINKNGQFTVCIALINNGKPVFGIVSAPALGEIYYGGAGLCSYVINPSGQVKQMHVATSPTGIVFVSKSHQSEPTSVYIKDKYPNATLLDMGSQLKFIQIANGKGDAHPRLGTTMRIWDVAAGHAIVEGAGGRVTRPNGSLIDYSKVGDNLYIGDFVASAFDIT